MATIQIDLLQSGIEQGNIGSSGNTSSTKHLRTTLYIPYLYNVNNIVTISATSSNTAKTVQCELIGYVSDTTTSRLFYQGFYAVPYEFDISSYSTVKFVRVLIRYSDSSVITPEEITSCTLSYNYMPIWTMDGEQPMPTQSMPMQQGRFIKPYPATLWRIDENNGGMPYNDLMPDILYYEPTPPIPTHAVKQKPYITLYRYDTPQDGFDTHGMWVLTPTKCTITEVLNGKYELSMEHPIDPEGRWEHIRENNIIKALGQLFTIRVVNQQWKGNSGKITCKADHIFYQLADSIIMRGDSGITGTRVAEVCRQAVAKIRDEDEGRPPLFHYQFSGSSNMTLKQEYIMANVDFLEKEKTMVDFIMGNGGVLEGSGGKLHRDNFYYSIYEDVEGSQKNAFEIRVGKNMTGIKRTIDIATQATHYSVYNQFGWGMSLWLTAETMRVYGIPHHIVRIKETSFTTNRILPQGGLENYAAIMCEEMCRREFKELCAPLVSYEVDVFEVRNNPEYAELVDTGGYKVGNSGTIVDPHIGTLTMEITQTITDALTGEVVNVLFGNRRDFVGKPAQGVIVDVDTEETTLFQVRDSEGFFCIDSEGALIIEYEGV